MIRIKRVGLRLSLQSGFAREVVQGILAFARKNGAWDFDLAASDPVRLLSWEQLRSWDGDGIIAPVHFPRHARLLLRRQIPVVNISDPLEAMPFPSVTFDNAAIGKLAAEHLLKQPLTRFVFAGPGEHGFSVRRYRAFAERLAAAGRSCRAIWTAPAPGAGVEEADSEWPELSGAAVSLRHLEPPVGILAANARTGWGVLQACHRLGWAVPDEVCVLSADDDDVLCPMATPALSGIQTPGGQLGAAAAAMLDKLMNQRRLLAHRQVIPPQRVVIRNSTDAPAVEDPSVAEALRAIRDHAHEPMAVSQVMSRISISRRSLERRFRRQVGRSLHGEIRRVHIERARELLLSTDATITRIARDSGYNSIQRFEAAFRRETGRSAAAFRKAEQRKEPAKKSTQA